MNDIAILGGTFDPIHNGHLVAGLSVLDLEEFDKVLVMPSGKPPHKDNRISGSDHRLKMCELAVSVIPGFEVSDFELVREGNIYTVETFRYLKAQGDGNRYWLIIGTDSLFNLKDWYKADVLLETVNFVVVDRGGYDNSQVLSEIERLNLEHQAHFKYASMPLMELSSTTIRERASKGLSLSGMVPVAVEAYIKDNQLY